MGTGAGRVVVDGERLLAVRAALVTTAEDLAAVAARATALAPSVLGGRRLVREVERAQADWATHVGALRRLADVAAADLGAAAAAYDGCEAAVAASLVPAVLGPPAPPVPPGPVTPAGSAVPAVPVAPGLPGPVGRPGADGDGGAALLGPPAPSAVPSGGGAPATPADGGAP